MHNVGVYQRVTLGSDESGCKVIVLHVRRASSLRLGKSLAYLKVQQPEAL